MNCHRSLWALHSHSAPSLFSATLQSRCPSRTVCTACLQPSPRLTDGPQPGLLFHCSSRCTGQSRQRLPPSAAGASCCCPVIWPIAPSSFEVSGTLHFSGFPLTWRPHSLFLLPGFSASGFKPQDHSLGDITLPLGYKYHTSVLTPLLILSHPDLPPDLLISTCLSTLLLDW